MSRLTCFNIRALHLESILKKRTRQTREDSRDDGKEIFLISGVFELGNDAILSLCCAEYQDRPTGLELRGFYWSSTAIPGLILKATWSWN
jgi:hypothetical protein